MQKCFKTVLPSVPPQVGYLFVTIQLLACLTLLFSVLTNIELSGLALVCFILFLRANVSICSIVVVAVSDLCLFTPLPKPHAGFQKAFDFCSNAPSYLKLMSAVENEVSITDVNVNTLLDVLKENRDNFEIEEASVVHVYTRSRVIDRCIFVPATIEGSVVHVYVRTVPSY